MSAHDKDPLEKQATPSESSSSESHSDSEVEKAEENLEHLKIGDLQAKEATKDCKDTKPLDSPDHKDTPPAKHDLSSQPVAGPSGLQKPRLPSPIGILDPMPEATGLPDPQKKNVEAKDADEDIGGGMVESDSETTSNSPLFKPTGATPLNEPDGEKMDPAEDSDTTSSSSCFIQSSTGVTPKSELEDENRDFRCRLPAQMEPGNIPMPASLARYYLKKHTQYATDSANTSSDVSEIRSEIADIPTEKSFEKEESPGFGLALERQNSETSDSNISDLQDDYLPPLPSRASTTSSEQIAQVSSEQESEMSELPEDSAPPPTESVSASTDSREQGHRAYLAQLMREAEQRGRPVSTSSGFGSTDPSALANLQAWGAAGEAASYRHNEQNVIDLPSPNIPDLGAMGGESQPAHQSMEQRISRDRQMLVHEQEPQHLANVEEQNEPEDAMSECVARKMSHVEKDVQELDMEAASPSKRRRFSKCLSESSKEEEIVQRLRPRHKPASGKKSKSLPGKPSCASQSSSEASQPKSSSSDELLRKDSPEIKSSSKSRESSPSETGRKPWQKSGLLRSRQISTMSSKDSVIVEEDEDRASSLKEQDSEPMVMKRAVPAQMENSTDKSAEVACGIVEQSSEGLEYESSDQTYVSEAEITLKKVEESFEVPEFERSVGKSKRHQKLSNSPPSDETLGSSPPEAATAAEAAPKGRPKKKSRQEKLPTRRTRHDSGDPLLKSVSRGNLQQTESTSSSDTSDNTLSDEEKETAL